MRRPRLAIDVGLVTAVVVAYLPVLGAGFLAWDDDLHVTANPLVTTPGFANVIAAFTTLHATGNWIPLTWLSHMLDVALFGLEPSGHHAMNLVLHAANTLLVFHVLERLTGARWQSATVAALFGLHPLHVESVAWVAERKDLLSTTFALLAIGAYAHYVAAPDRRRWLVVATWFTAGLLAKPMVMTLPLILLLLDYWPLRRASLAAAREKIPLVALAAAAGAIALIAQRQAGALHSGASIAMGDRLANAVVSYVRYLELTAWPVTLSPWYSHPALEGVPLTPAAVVTAAAVLLGITTLVWRQARARPHLLVGWLWYLVTLVPVIGVLQVGGQAMADRFTYLPLLGIFIAVVWEVAALPVWRTTALRRCAIAGTLAILAAFGVRTWQQTHVWHDTTMLWHATLRANPRAAIAYYGLAGVGARQGRIDEAIHDYRRALKLRPDFVNAHTEVGHLLVQRRRLGAAAAHYRKAIAVRPNAAVDETNLGNVLVQQNNLVAGRRHLERAVQLRPDFPEAHSNLGIVLANLGDLEAAAKEFQTALRLRPTFSAAETNLKAVREALQHRDEQ